jgi:hypothetical protein
MNLRDLAEKGRRLIERRGGTKALKEDAEELRDIARSKETIGEKAKDAAEALKDPGAPDRPRERGPRERR